MFKRDSVSVAISSENPRRYFRIALRPGVLRNLLALVILVFGTLALLFFSPGVAAVTRTWDGGGVTNNWSEPANWSGDVAPDPLGGDFVIFDGTSSENVTIDVPVIVSGFQINSPYGGEISQGSSNVTVNGASSQSSGTFTGGSGVIDFNSNFAMFGGIFTASSSTTSFAFNFDTHLGGTFNHNGGTVLFDGGGDSFVDLPTSLTLNNVTVNKTGAGRLAIQDGDTLVVAATLALTNGEVVVNGSFATLEAQGAVLIASTFDGGNINLLISGAATRTVTLGAGSLLPRLTVNAPNVTVNTSGTGAITFTLPVTIQSVGLFTNGTVDFIFFNLSVPFAQSGGTFTGGSGLIDFNSNFTLSGGAFTASSTTTSFATNFTQTGGTFTADVGTVVFDGVGETFLDVLQGGVAGLLTLNNVTVNKTGGQFSRQVAVAEPDVLIVRGTLTLTDGIVNTNGTVATLEAQGNVSIASTFEGGNINFRFGGTANQTFSNNGGVNPTGAWIVNKPSGAVTLASNLILNDNQALSITSGRLDQGASFNLQTSNTLTVGANGILGNFGVGDLTLGGNLTNNGGVVNINGGGTGCGDPGADPLQIRSTVDTTVLTWSGNGTFSLVDVNVDSQTAGSPPGTIIAFGSSVLGPNMGAGWTTDPADPDDCPVEVTSHPSNQTACLGGSASFSVTATGASSFQWRKGGTPLLNGGNISGAQSATLTINPVGSGDAGSYDVVVTSSLGITATSNPATLTIVDPPAITDEPDSATVCVGGSVSFSVTATGAALTFQWRRNGTPLANGSNISGADTPTLTINPVSVGDAATSGAGYDVVVSGACSPAVASTRQALTVNTPDLAIDKSHTGDFTVGTNGVYTIAVTNAGTCSTTGTITVTDTLPNGLTFVSGTGTGWNCSAIGQDVTCTNAGPIASTAVSTITLTVSVAQAAVPAVTNTANVSTPNDTNAANNSDSDPTTVNGAGPPINPGDLIISEFRVRGPGGANDEFVEIYNNTDANITAVATDGSTGFALVASDGVARFVIPNNTTIPARGHFLGVNSGGYSLSAYPGGNAPIGAKGVHPRPQREPRPSPEGSWDLGEDTVSVGGSPQPLVPTATGDISYTTDISDNSGIALFNTANPANFTLANRLDAVGSVAETNTLYKEGPVGLPDLNPDLLPAETEYSWVRRLTGGCTGTDPAGFNNNCTTTALVQNTAPSSSGRSQDTDNNEADFLFVSTNGGTGAGLSEDLQRLGAPGPENLSAPIVRGNPNGSGTINPSLIDPDVASFLSPNRERVTCPIPGTCGPNQEFGTLDIRRRFTNNTTASLTRLKFRIMDISTFPNGPGIADIRALTSSDVMVTVTGGGTVTVHGTTVEEDTSAPNLGQPMGGGYNSSLSAGVITLAAPLNPGASVNVRFVFGVEGSGKFRVFVVVEALP